RAIDAIDSVWEHSLITPRRAAFVADGDYVENNWRDNPNGEVYRDVTRRAGADDLLRRLETDLQPQIHQVYDTFSRRYGWGDTTVPGANEPSSSVARTTAEPNTGRGGLASEPGSGPGYDPREAGPG